MQNHQVPLPSKPESSSSITNDMVPVASSSFYGSETRFVAKEDSSTDSPSGFVFVSCMDDFVRAQSSEIAVAIPARYCFLSPSQNSSAFLLLSAVSSIPFTWKAPISLVQTHLLTFDTLLLLSSASSCLKSAFPPSFASIPHASPDSNAHYEEVAPKCPPLVLRFSSSQDLEGFCDAARRTIAAAQEQQTHLDTSDSATIQAYFQYYAKLSNQMNMLQDTVRTKTYSDAILLNAKDFYGKRVMDVGAGSGILSFFSSQAGAQIVYVVEASSMASAAGMLAAANPQLGATMKVLNSTVERVSLDRDLDNSKVDILVSEPIGTFIINERMIESFLYARDMFLKPGGRMYPNRCTLFLAPFSDSALYHDLGNRAQFWTNTNFYGIDLNAVYPRALDELLRQPVVDYIDPNTLASTAWHRETFDLETIPRDALTNIEIKYRFPFSRACVIHGIAGWFDVLFEGGEQHVGFSTSPLSPPTHWYQIRFLFREPIAVNPRQTIVGTLHMTATTQKSYYVTADATIEGTDIYTSTTVVDLKDPDFRYYSNPQSPYIPPVRSIPDPNIVFEPAKTQNSLVVDEANTTEASSAITTNPLN